MSRTGILAALVVACGAAAYGGYALLNQPEPMTLTNAQITTDGAAPGEIRVYLTIQSNDRPDMLISASSPEAEHVEFGGLVVRDSYAIPANASPVLSGDGVYLTISGLFGVLEEGRMIPITLEFADSGPASTRARVGAVTDPMAGLEICTVEDEIGLPAELTAASLAEIAAGTVPLSAPDLRLLVSQTADGSFAVEIETEHFTFDPLTENPVHVPGHGHGHLYLNGIKLQRLYSTTATIGALPQGDHVVMVTLNTNTHETYVGDDGPVMASTTISVD